jgi:hypothetical protein
MFETRRCAPLTPHRAQKRARALPQGESGEQVERPCINQTSFLRHGHVFFFVALLIRGRPDQARA